MLKSLKIRNFHSIGDEQEISFAVSPKDVLDDSARFISDDSALNLTSCVVGPNASGKTNFLKAITFLFWFVESSYTSQKSESPIPFETHKLKNKEPTSIEVTFCDNHKLYNYFVEFTKKEILRETLSKKNERMASIFEFTRNGEDVTLKTRSGLKINEADEKRFTERRNVPLLSSLIDTKYLPDITFFKNYESNVTQLGLSNYHLFSHTINASQALYKDELLKNQILSFIKNVDFGISDFKFREISIFSNKDNLETGEKAQVLQCIHNSKKANFELDIYEESNGTQHSFSVLADALPILKTGGLVVFDEIDAGLHPYVVKKIISLFESKETNPKNAQLIFSTHQHLLLKDRTKTQIFITERDRDSFETEIYRLDDVEGVRNDENYFHKYISGAYGGTPKIDWL